MRKALVTVLLSAAALVAGTVAATAPAAADEVTSAAADAPACVTPAAARFDGRWTATDPSQLHATLRGTAGAVLCEDVALNVSVYLVPDTWNGKGFNRTAVPQALVEAGHAPDLVFPKDTPVGTKLTADVTEYLPECSNYQVDLYTGKKLDTVDAKGHGGAFITGGLVKGDLDADECTEPTPSTTTTTPSEETTTTTPAEETTTTTAPAEETTTTTAPAEETTTTVPSEETTTTDDASTTEVSETTTAVAGTTTVAPTTSTAPALAFTGAAGTGTLVGLGAALLVGGVGITLLAASRRGAHRG